MNTGRAVEVTRLLQQWGDGDKAAEGKLWPLVFAELKRLARRLMARERGDHTLQSGALVNEAYIRLTGWDKARFENRLHFFGMCARMMRQILVDHARSREYQKRGGGGYKVALDESAIVSQAADRSSSSWMMR
jgi:RNA polymerase sigma factor (TIGR02999 family)